MAAATTKKRKTVAIEALHPNELKFLREFPLYIAMANESATQSWSEFRQWLREGHVRYCLNVHAGIHVDDFPEDMTNAAYVAAPAWVAYHKAHECLKRADIPQPNPFLV